MMSGHEPFQYDPSFLANRNERDKRVDELLMLPAMPLTTLPTDKQERKDTPIVSGVLDYFPAALAEIARVSKVGNDQHNPGQPMHHARGKASDHADCIVRHLIERGTIDTDGMRHSAKVAWRALALLQQELEDAGAPLARGARLPEPEFTHSPSFGGVPDWMRT